MSIENIKNKLKKNSKQDKSWIERAKYREINESWLDISFNIAVKIMSQIKNNKVSNTFPKTQKELASALDCSPQYVNKLLKGTENLQLETITKLESILDIRLIQVPDFKTSFKLNSNPSKIMIKSTKDVYYESNTSNYKSLKESFFNTSEDESHLKPVA